VLFRELQGLRRRLATSNGVASVARANGLTTRAVNDVLAPRVKSCELFLAWRVQDLGSNSRAEGSSDIKLGNAGGDSELGSTQGGDWRRALASDAYGYGRIQCVRWCPFGLVEELLHFFKVTKRTFFGWRWGAKIARS
jgi:hypothetical protein